ncbi:MAG: histidine kinase [Rhodanobacter sp.]|nr:MAG: histidine kinase [Rhodanobacter sp.]TAM01317.1 MAG: histidine kinase [Rhodanobacter sp.]TAM39506.1 MAG: histidine kinase [Rhodanobacter sp.]TAN29077.1 MAG: histidine kinase [Rhodanobacter sp.]
MQLKSKIALLAVLPLVVVAGAIAGVIALQGQRLATDQATIIDANLMQAKRVELKHYVGLAISAIGPLYASGRGDAATQDAAKDILARMNYGDDGYYFVYDLQGRNLVHPRQPDIVGHNLWDLRDPKGLPVIQRLVADARHGSGFQRYLWSKPSTGQITPKLGYVVLLPRWGWVLGTGVYLDDVSRIENGLRRHVAANIRVTMGQIAAISLIAVTLVGLIGMALNVSVHRLADRHLKVLAQRIVNLQEEERLRIARDLHDGINQLLASAKYQFELAQYHVNAGDGDPISAIGRGLSVVSDAIGEVRRISHDLHPMLLDRLGLAEALGQLAREFSERTGIRVTASLPEAIPVLPGPLALTLFRIAQESLTNIERHSGATYATLGLKVVAARARLSVTDDGHGFAPGSVAVRDGMGLNNIHGRVDYLRGVVTIDTGPSGTTLSVVLPLDADTRSPT